MVFAVVWGYLLFAERPDAVAIVGLVLIAAAGVLVAGRSAGVTGCAADDRGVVPTRECVMADAMGAVGRKLADGDTVVLDGATGTELQRRGAPWTSRLVRGGYGQPPGSPPGGSRGLYPSRRGRDDGQHLCLGLPHLERAGIGRRGAHPELNRMAVRVAA